MFPSVVYCMINTLPRALPMRDVIRDVVCSTCTGWAIKTRPNDISLRTRMFRKYLQSTRFGHGSS